jgi:hypothetical protein
MNLKTLRHAGTCTFLAGTVLALTALRAHTQQPDIRRSAATSTPWVGGAMMHVDGSCVQPDGSKCAAYPDLKVIALSKTDRDPAVTLTAANVANRSYPLTRDSRTASEA